ncbi:hypothetical protein ACKC6H_002743 [Acinetobacter baumannii]
MLFKIEEINSLEFFKDTASLSDQIYNKLNGVNLIRFFERYDLKEYSFDEFFGYYKDIIIFLDNLLIVETNYNNNLEYQNNVIEDFNKDLKACLSSEEVVPNLYALIESFFYVMKRFFKNIFLPTTYINELANDTGLKLHDYILNILDNSDIVSGVDKKSNTYSNRILELENKIKYIEEDIIKGKNGYLLEERAKIQKEADITVNLYKEKFENLLNIFEPIIPGAIEELKQKIRNSKDEVDNLDNAINSYKSIVTEKVENEFSGFYRRKAIEEKILYYFMTVISLCFIFASLRLAWLTINKYYKNFVDPIGLKRNLSGLKPSEIDLLHQTAFIFFSLRLVISILLFLTVIYTGRIAYRSYLHWRHSQNTFLKLSSLRPFITDLPIEDRRQIRKDLVPDYFGKDAGNIDNCNESFKDLPTNVSTIAAKAIEQVGNNITGKGNTEKNTKKSEDETK